METRDGYNSIWDDKNLVKELDSRVESYENGTAKVFTFEEMKRAVIETYEARKKLQKENTVSHRK